MKKAIVIIVMLIIAFPFVPKLLPKPMTIERVESSFKATGLQIDSQSKGGAALEAAESWYYTIGTASVEVYRYENHAKLVKNQEYQKDDAGSIMVEAWNLSESLGAAKNPNPRADTAKKKMFMIVVKCDDNNLRGKIISAFRSS